MRTTRVLPLLLAVALAAACTAPQKPTDEGTGGTAVAGSGTSQSGVNDGSMGKGSNLGGGALGGPNASAENRVIYFAYDSYDVKPDYNAIIAANGKYLQANPKARVRLEGHTDERGSREYNIGLGERRAQAVRKAFLLQGASPDQVATVSYGEERPAAVGNDEDAWSLNRRVEIVYIQ